MKSKTEDNLLQEVHVKEKDNSPETNSDANVSSQSEKSVKTKKSVKIKVVVKSIEKKTIMIALAFIAIILVTNPSLIPFLPMEAII